MTEKNTKSKFSFMIIISFLIIMLMPLAMYAQPDDEKIDKKSNQNPFQLHLFPTYNSDYTYYVLRNNMQLDHGLIGLNVTSDQDKNIDIKGKAFLPLIDTKGFDLSLPVYMYKDTIESKDSSINFKKEIFNFFWQSLFQYYASENLTFVFITESRTKGDTQSFTSLPGNEFGGLFLVKYRLSQSWSIAPLTRVQYYWYDDQEVLKPVVGGQIIWTPSEKFKAMIGVPGLLGIEWALPADFDFTLNVMIQDLGIPIVAALRKRWHPFFDTTIRYIREGYKNLYLKQQTILVDGISESYNNITFYKDIFQLELTFNTSMTSLIQLKGGYYITEDIILRDDEDKVTSFEGKDNIFFGVNFMSRFY